MAASLNKVLLMGNLTRDPELRYIPSGAAVANFTLAVNRVYKDNAGEKKEEASFIRVVVWGKMAEVCGEYLGKGKPVLVEGRLKSRTWEAQDGQKRSALDVVATNVQFLGARGEKKADTGNTQSDDYAKSDAPSGYDTVESIDVDKEAKGDEIPF
jgi:single-strand DNA-binding protein